MAEHTTVPRPKVTGAVAPDAQLFHKGKVLSARVEIAIRRAKWSQAMTEHNHAHLQTMSAIWETASRRGTNVDGRRFPITTSEPICGGFL